MQNNRFDQEHQDLRDDIREYIQELSNLVRKRCKYLDEYQQVLINEEFFELFPFSHETPFSPFDFNERGTLFDKTKEEQALITLSSDYQKFDIENRTALNENCYKEIFFLLNRIINNDKTYDKYIYAFRTSLLSELNLYVFNSYFEIVKKELERVIEYKNVSPKRLIEPLEIFKEIDTLCDKYGIDYVMAANESLRNLLDKKDIGLANVNTYNRSLEQLIKGNFIVSNETSNSEDKYSTYENIMPGVGRTIYEIKKYLLEKANKKGINIESMSQFITKLRNVGSHGEFEFNVSTVTLKNNQSIVTSPSGNDFFTTQELNDISKKIIEKGSKFDGIHPDLFSPMLERLLNILTSQNPSEELGKITTEPEKIEMINLLVCLSLFSIVQLNSENMFKYLTDTSDKTFMSEITTILPIKRITRDSLTNDIIESDTILGQDSSKSTLLEDFQNIKNAVGHNNVYISFFNIICANDYMNYRRKRSNTREVFLNSTDFIKRKKYVQISFKVTDWIKYISDNDFFLMISLPVIEQSEIISRYRK